MNICIKDYHILRELGHGSSGVVYLGEQSGQYFAIKKILRTPSHDETRVLEEVNAMISFQNKATESGDFDGCVHFIECFQDERSYYIVMEFCDQGTLETKFNDVVSYGEQFTEEALWMIASELSYSLMLLKQNHIIHRDIKPENIYIGANSNLKLGDMGYARQLVDTLDMTISPVGTPYYVAPEVLELKGYRSQCDVWSLGVTLYQLTQQALPFDGHTKDIVFHRIKTAPMPPITVGVSDALKDMIRRMLIKDPSSRITIEEVNAIATAHISRQE
ncbi:putative Aurora kinase [Blattamonas nauphoetae]|uniref:non-specific serine/threonine protein kinase n=1 Tax=Blattamonas nauphoetae TaxID=2049346 RepID=A0ABQ9Y2K2_9EUKA|nr:putative Aurora kinase [Blattamonas nauphoetae]